jgi:hypothetical protein
MRSLRHSIWLSLAYRPRLARLVRYGPRCVLRDTASTNGAITQYRDESAGSGPTRFCLLPATDLHYYPDGRVIASQRLRASAGVTPTWRTKTRRSLAAFAKPHCTASVAGQGGRANNSFGRDLLGRADRRPALPRRCQRVRSFSGHCASVTAALRGRRRPVSLKVFRA